MQPFSNFSDFCANISRMLCQLSDLFHQESQAFYAYRMNKEYYLVAGSGIYSTQLGKKINDVLPETLLMDLNLAIKTEIIMYFQQHVFVCFKGENGSESILYVEIRIEPVHLYVFDMLVESFRFFIRSWELSKQMEMIQREFIYMLSEAAEIRSAETGNHVRGVAEYSRILAKGYGLGIEDVDLIYLAAPMHDVGKLAVPDCILNKPGQLNSVEFEVIKKHCLVGYKMLERLKEPIMQTAAIIAYEHHERVNGSGYPRGLKGAEISLPGRIVAIADVFEALATERVYKKAWPFNDIVKFMVSESGSSFDPYLINVFLAKTDEFSNILEALTNKKVTL